MRTTFAVFFFLSAILAVHVACSSSATLDLRAFLLPLNSACRRSVADCGLFSDDDEFVMDSDTNRRILAATRYISYGALQRNTAPCSRLGASYYNCRPDAQANPYPCSPPSHTEKEERSEKLSDLLNVAESETAAAGQRKEEALAELKHMS